MYETPQSQPRQFTRENHYLPQFYQRVWSQDGERLARYRLLVSDEREPLWGRPRIGGSGMRLNLYTSTAGGTASDELERWIGQEIETPAAPAVVKLGEGKRITADEWRLVTRFAMAMDVRTPLSYLLWKERTTRAADGVLKQTLEQVPVTLSDRERGGVVAPTSAPSVEHDRPLPLRVRKEVNENGRIVGIGAEVLIGREMWLWSIRHTLTETIRHIPKPKWALLRPAPGYQWFTSDQPLLRLGYNGPADFDFGGGWGRRGCEIILPLSPDCLLYCKVGERQSGIHQLSTSQTEEMQRLLALRAFREILAERPVDHVPSIVARQVDPLRVRAERKMWDEFHDEQTQEHAAFYDDDGPILVQGS